MNRGLCPSRVLTTPLAGIHFDSHQTSDTTAVASHEGVAPDVVVHLRECQGTHGYLAGAVNFEPRLSVEGDQEVLTHEDGAAHAGLAAQVLQVAPQQDGALALLAEGAVDGQDVDVNCGAVRLVQDQGILDSEGGGRRGDPFLSMWECLEENMSIIRMHHSCCVS